MIKLYKVMFAVFSLFMIFNILLLAFTVGVGLEVLTIAFSYICIYSFHRHILYGEKTSVLFTIMYTVISYYYITGGDFENITQSNITIAIYVLLVLPAPLLALYISVCKGKEIGFTL